MRLTAEERPVYKVEEWLAPAIVIIEQVSEWFLYSVSRLQPQRCKSTHTGICASSLYMCSRQALFTKPSFTKEMSCPLLFCSMTCDLTLAGNWNIFIDPSSGTSPSSPTLSAPMLLQGVSSDPARDGCSLTSGMSSGTGDGVPLADLSSAASSSATRCSSRCVYDNVGDL